MQTQERLQAAGVIGQLFDAPAVYQFRQALRILLLWLRSQGVSYDDAFKHVLRFQNSLSLGFPASEIESLKAELIVAENGEARSAPGTAPERIALTPTFIGLLGANGTLPFHYSERIASQQLHSKDDSARAFLDLLSNRMVGLFFETWGKYRLEASLDTHGTDRLRGMLTQLGGASEPDATRHPSSEIDAEAYYAAAFRTRPVSASAVADILNEHFGVPVQLEQFVGCWDALGPHQQTIMGHAGPTLGRGATLGKRIWRCDMRLRLNIGPLDIAQRDRCLPHGSIATGMKRMMQRFGMSNSDCEVRLLLKPACVRPAVLKSNTSAPDRLGWGSFLATSPGSPAYGDVRFLFKMRDGRETADKASGQVA